VDGQSAISPYTLVSCRKARLKTKLTLSIHDSNLYSDVHFGNRLVGSRLYHVRYGVVLDGRIDKITGLFCKRDLSKTQCSAKETYSFIDPTNCSHPICRL